MTMTKTDEKLLEAISPYIEGLQEFVDEHIRGANMMTAKVIFEKFSKLDYDLEESGLEEETRFVNAFRAAVRHGKITGIESAKRWGYREAGTSGGPARVNRPSPEDLAKETLRPFLDDLRKFVDAKIQGSTTMTAKVIYEQFSNTTPKMKLSEDEFIKAFRLCVRAGEFELQGAQRKGYRRKGAVVEEDTEESEGLEKSEKSRNRHESCEIVIDSRRKVVALDNHNWAYQVRSESSSSWHIEAYFANTESMLRSLARRLLDDELKGMEDFNLAEAAKKISEAETRIAALLEQVMPEREEKVA